MSRPYWIPGIIVLLAVVAWGANRPDMTLYMLVVLVVFLLPGKPGRARFWLGQVMWAWVVCSFLLPLNHDTAAWGLGRPFEAVNAQVLEVLDGVPWLWCESTQPDLCAPPS